VIYTTPSNSYKHCKKSVPTTSYRRDDTREAGMLVGHGQGVGGAASHLAEDDGGVVAHGVDAFLQLLVHMATAENKPQTSSTKGYG
jgi:hypothetical protein